MWWVDGCPLLKLRDADWRVKGRVALWPALGQYIGVARKVNPEPLALLSIEKNGSCRTLREFRPGGLDVATQ